MILLDTHVWVWWVQGDARLSKGALRSIDAHSADGLGVSLISCWEVALLYYRNRLAFPVSLDNWMDGALTYPGVRLVDLSVAIVVDSCRLADCENKDPADRMIAATARALNCTLLTADRKLLSLREITAVHPEDFSSC